MDIDIICKSNGRFKASFSFHLSIMPPSMTASITDRPPTPSPGCNLLHLSPSNDTTSLDEWPISGLLEQAPWTQLQPLAFPSDSRSPRDYQSR